MDRSLIRSMLALSPEQRVAQLTQEARFLKMIDEARKSRRRTSAQPATNGG